MIADAFQNGVIINQTELSNEQLRSGVEEHWAEIAGAGFNQGVFSERQSDPGSLFVRQDYAPPSTTIEEMELAMRLNSEDDDVGGTIGMMISNAFKGGEILHQDPEVVRKMTWIAEQSSMLPFLRDLYENLAVTNSAYVMTVFTTKTMPAQGRGRKTTLRVPQMCLLNPLSVRVISRGAVDKPVLIQQVDDSTQQILERLRSPRTTAAERNKLRAINPIAEALYIQQFEPSSLFDDDNILGATNAWVLNPQMVSRYTLLRRAWSGKYPPVTMKRVFGVAEAKRLLNILDYSLLQGGINFLIVAKKGSDQYPAIGSELANLGNVVRRAAKTGVIIGDHRLDIEIIMPNMDALLDNSRRSLLGRKLAKGILRLPDIEFGRVEGGGTPEAEIVANAITSDRNLIRNQLQSDVIRKTVERNQSQLGSSNAPTLWFPPLILSGDRFFVDYVLKLRDRGDIPRSWAVEAAGYKSEAAFAERQREIESGWDEVMTAQNVPNSGSESPDNGRPRSQDSDPTGDDG